MAKTKLNVLKEMPIFGAVDDNILALLIDTSNKVKKKAGEYFFQQDDESQSMFVLLLFRFLRINNEK